MSEMTREDVITVLRHPLNNTCQEAQLRNEQVVAHDAAQRQTITQLEAELKQEHAEHEVDVAQLVKHCACEWEGEEPRRHTVTCGTHRKLEARVSELEDLYANSCSALNAHMEIHAQVVNRVKELEGEVATWKAEAKWAAVAIVNTSGNDKDLERDQRMLNGTL